MKKVKIILSMVLAVVLSHASHGQSASNPQMEQDIEVMESILNELFNVSDDGHFRSNRVSGNYLPGYGVVFRVPKSSNRLIYRDDLIDNYNTGHYTALALTEGKDNLHQKLDSIVANRSKINENNYRLFFTNYGDLITSLKPGEKIMIIHGKTKTGSTFFFPSADNGQGNIYTDQSLNKRDNDKTTVQVAYEDIQAFTGGKLSEEQFHKKIVINEATNQGGENTEFDILAKIFNRIYKDNDNWSHFGGKVSYELIDGLGVIYEMSSSGIIITGSTVSSFNLSSSQDVVVSGRAQSARTTERKTREELKAERAKKYDEYLQDLQSNMIKYGKTLKSLNNDDVLMLSVNMPNCYSCDYPDKINLIVKASNLKAYSQRKISLQEAINTIKLREIN